MEEGGKDVVAQNRGNNVSIDINPLIDSIKGKLHKISPVSSGAHCIYKVHDKLRKINESAYTPEMVAIGPFHHDKESLQAMEEHKLLYTKALLSRSGPLEVKLQECVKSISEVEEEARNCYSKPIKLHKGKFIEIMVVDGLFLIELCQKICRFDVELDGDDPLFMNDGYIGSLLHDIILLENQLPMLVLHRLLEKIKGNQRDVALNKIALGIFSLFMPCALDAGFRLNRPGDHLLDLIGNIFYDGLHQNETSGFQWLSPVSVPCAAELEEAGVKFLKRSSWKNILDIKFEKGVLEIPPIVIQDCTESIFRNLVALEQYNARRAYITSYAIFMDSLINSTKDVLVLKKCGIITTYLGDDELVSSLFNKLCNEVNIKDFYYSKQFDEINKYTQKSWPKYRASLKRRYFRSPWTAISIFAGTLLFSLAIVSTTFACLSYFVHKS